MSFLYQSFFSADAVMERAEENGNTVSGMEGEGTVSGSDTVSGADGSAITAVVLSLNEGAPDTY